MTPALKDSWEEAMHRRAALLTVVVTAGAAFVAGLIVAGRMRPVEAQAKAALSFAAVPGEKNTQDVFGPYEVVRDWPKPLSSLPGHEKWTWGAVESVFAESPNRVFILERGEIPNLKRPEEVPYPQVGPSISFPVSQVPWRNASVGPVTAAGNPVWSGKLGVDARWEHCLVVVDANGNITEQWTQWDAMLKRPHFVTINPYDPEKHVWVVDDQGHAVYEFTHDGKQLVKTLGTPGKSGEDDKHFNRPTFINWLPDGTMYVTDGYGNTRVVKFNKDGKYLMAWGQRANPPNDTRPGYFDAVHGVVFDLPTHRVFVTDRSDRRIEIFDENGKFLDQWSTGNPSTPQFLYKAADGNLWIADGTTSKILKYDLDGHFLYSWGSGGDWPGAMWNVHGMSVDQEGNLYLAEVNNGRAEKFRPRAGANPALIVGQPVRAAWK
jgi:DNA-binding beta-propeller fold protein YncE